MVVFLVEEASMADFLSELLPRLAPGLLFLCVSHDGKSDLRRAWQASCEVGEDRMCVSW